jgi:hypothetical protein
LVADGKNPEATDLVLIRKIVTDNGYTSYQTQNGYKKFVIDDNPSRKRMETAAHGDIVFLPKNVTWVNLKSNVKDMYDVREEFEKCRSSVIDDPKLITRWLDAKMQEGGAKVATVRSDGSGFWRVENGAVSYAFPKAIEKIATKYHIPVFEAVGIMKEAQEHGRANVRIVKGGNAIHDFLEGVYKEAQMPMEAQMSQQMPAGGGMPPQGDPAMMGQPQPQAQPSMNPTDLAITEAVQQLQQQNQMQMQEMQSQAREFNSVHLK